MSSALFSASSQHGAVAVQVRRRRAEEEQAASEIHGWQELGRRRTPIPVRPGRHRPQRVSAGKNNLRNQRGAVNLVRLAAQEVVVMPVCPALTPAVLFRMGVGPGRMMMQPYLAGPGNQAYPIPGPPTWVGPPQYVVPHAATPVSFPSVQHPANMSYGCFLYPRAL